MREINIIEEITQRMTKINSRGKYCTFSFKSSEGVLKYESYIATGNESGPSHLHHETLNQVVLRFNRYLENSKGECIVHLTQELARHRVSTDSIQAKLDSLLEE